MFESKVLMISVTVLFALAALVLLGTKSSVIVKGNGVVKEKTYPCGNLSEVNVGGVWQVKIITGAAQNQVKLSVEENILELVELELANNKLNVKIDGSINPTKPMLMEISLQKLPEEISASGASRIEIGKNSAEKLECRLSGVAKLEIAESKFDTLKLNLTGSSQAKLEVSAKLANIDIHGSSKLDGKGEIERLSLNSAGAAQVKLEKIGDVEIKISGASKFEFERANTLKGLVSGAGSLKYKELGTVDVKTSGAAKTSGRSAVRNDLVWVEALIEQNEYNQKYKLPGPMTGPEFITVHNTAEPFSAMQERDRVDFRRDDKSVSFHFTVDELGAVQLMPLNIHAWHAGDGAEGKGNTSSIGIEICRSQYYGRNERRYRRAEDNAVKLCAWLLNYYKMDIDKLRMHQDWSGKYCPHRILSENRWEDFKSRVEAQLKQVPQRTDRKQGLLRNQAEAVVFETYQDRPAWKSFHGDMAFTIDEFAEKLKARKIDQIEISCWNKTESHQENIEAFQKHGIRVLCYYIMKPDTPEWLRQNLLQPEDEFEQYRKSLKR